LEQVRAEAGFTGITAGVVLADGKRYAAAAGFADPDKKIALTPTSRMLAGSTGKTFAAAAILLAVDEHKLDLDSKIEKWIGREPWFDRLPNGHDLTLRLLMSHRTGVPEHVFDKNFVAAMRADPDRFWTPTELVAYILDKKALFAAGEKFAYADTNFVIAGLVFETATKRKLYDEVDRRILKPFELTHTVTSESRIIDALVPGQMSERTPFGIGGPSIVNGRLVLNAQSEYAGGGMISTGGDLARWAKILWEGKAFSAKSLQAMLDAKDTGIGRGGGVDAKYGLATQVHPTPFGTGYAHAGWFPGYQTEMEYFPDSKVAIAIQVPIDPGMGAKKSPRWCMLEIAKLVLEGNAAHD
jgi:D-alanyl-D-alanine carboxypeptidase